MNETIDNQLQLSVPEDLREVWDYEGFDRQGRKFIYYNYGEVKFLSNTNLHKLSPEGNVGGAINESNSL